MEGFCQPPLLLRVLHKWFLRLYYICLSDFIVELDWQRPVASQCRAPTIHNSQQSQHFARITSKVHHLIYIFNRTRDTTTSHNSEETRTWCYWFQWHRWRWQSIWSTCFKGSKITSNTGRPKAADYEAAARELILSVANTYLALLATQGAFPTSSEELVLVKMAWKMVNDDSETNPLSLTPDIVRIVSTFLFLFQIFFFPNSYFQLKDQDSRLSGLWQGQTKDSLSCWSAIWVWQWA